MHRLKCGKFKLLTMFHNHYGQVTGISVEVFHAIHAFFGA